MMAIPNKRKKNAMKTKPTSCKLDPEPVWKKTSTSSHDEIKKMFYTGLNTSALSEHSHVGKLVHCIEFVIPAAAVMVGELCALDDTNNDADPVAIDCSNTGTSEL